MIDPEKLAQAAACLDTEPKATHYEGPIYWQPARNGFQFGTRWVGNDIIRVWREVPDMSSEAVELQDKMREAWAKVKL